MKKNQNISVRRPKGLDDRIIEFIAYTLCILVLILTLYPLVYVVSASISDPVRVTRGELVLFPISPTLEGYKTILEYDFLYSIRYGDQSSLYNTLRLCTLTQGLYWTQFYYVVVYIYHVL